MSMPTENAVHDMTGTTQDVWFITGTSRGIGLEMTQQLLRSPSNMVIAACRDPAKASALRSLSTEAKGTLHVLSIDVNDSQSIRKCAEEVSQIVGDQGVDYLVNNAAVNINQEDYAFSMDVNVMQQDFVTNVVGPAYVAQAFITLVEKSRKKTIVNISSTLGSMGTDFGAFHASYSVTKAALNMLTYKEAKEKPDVTAVCICPGWLQTDMGGSNASLPVSAGVAGVLKTISGLSPEDSGLFFNFKGERVPW